MNRIALYVAALAILAWSFFPFFAMGIISIMDEPEMITKGMLHIPERFNGENYLALFGLVDFSQMSLGRAIHTVAGQVERFVPSLLNSFVVALAASTIGIIMATLVGYAFGRYRFPLKTAFLFVFLMTRMLPPVAVIIPYFALFSKTGLNGTYEGLIITHLTFIIPLAGWVLMGYFATLPVETERAARIDGCTRWSTIRHIILPMGKAGIVATWILAFLLSWNELLFALILTGGTTVQTLQPVIIQLSPSASGTQAGYGMVATAGFVGALIPLVLALIFQRFITRLNIVDPVSTVQ